MPIRGVICCGFKSFVLLSRTGKNALVYLVDTSSGYFCSYRSMAGSNSASEFPWQHSFPPFYTLQPHQETRRKQLDAWRSIVLGNDFIQFWSPR